VPHSAPQLGAFLNSEITNDKSTKMRKDRALNRLQKDLYIIRAETRRQGIALFHLN
jgi:hypothetical protein